MPSIETLVPGCIRCQVPFMSLGADGRRLTHCPACGDKLAAGHVCAYCQKFVEPDTLDEYERCQECRESGR